MYRARIESSDEPRGTRNEVWSMDFVADQLSDGRSLRALTVVDVYTRECSAIEVATRLTGNAIIESFNSRLREECLNTHWFESIDDAQRKIEDWRQEYNETRPHRALKGLSPLEFSTREMHRSTGD